jgi:arylsulfatase A-like enzyme
MPHPFRLGAPGAVSVALALLVGCTSSPGGEASRAVPRPHVFLLNVDMLRADHLGVHGYPRATTPELDRLAERGVWFSAARAHAPWTYPSVVSLLSGLHPSSHGAGYSKEGDQYVTTVVPEELDTMARVFDRAGYATAGFVTNPLLKRASGLDRGFDVYRDEFVREWKRQGGSWAEDTMRAENVHEALLEWLDQDVDGPRFAYVHYIDVHGPYLDPKPFGGGREVDPALAEQARLTGEPRDVAIDVYDGELAHLDGLIGALVRELDRRGILDDSIVIVTSDHGEEFGDHGGHGHGHTLYDELLRVPLIFVRTDAFPYTGRVDAIVGQVDLLPTLCDLAGLPLPPGRPGRTLRPLVERAAGADSRPLVAEMDNRGRPAWNSKPGDPEVAYALVLPPATKYVVGTVPSRKQPGGTTQEQLFDLRADPGETKNLVVDGETAARPRGLLSEMLARAKSVAVARQTAPIDAATQERLRALGYLPEEPAAP